MQTSSPRRRIALTLLVSVALPGAALGDTALEFSDLHVATSDIGAASALGPFGSGTVSAPASGDAPAEPPRASSALPWIIGGGLAVGAAVALAGGGGDGSPPPAPGLPGPDTPPPESGRDPVEFETSEYRRDYSLDMINASSRYADGGTGWGTILAVYDTGIDVDHADLAPNVAYTHSYFGTGSEVVDHHGHGTHVASIMAAAKNDFGMHGLAFDAQLAVFQGLGWDGAPDRDMGLVQSLADAQRRSASMGAAAINHSWVFVDDNDQERLVSEFTAQSLRNYLGSDALASFEESQAADMITVFAAGNQGQDDPSVMAGLPSLLPEFGSHWLGVTAVSSNGTIADYANRCGMAKDYCLAAPGSTIYGALSSDAGHGENAFGYKSGTSMAAPHVAAAVGVVKSNFPELTGSEISLILRETARDIGAPGIDEIYGHGLLDLENAVAPQGTIRIMTGNQIDDGAIALDDSWIAADASMSSSLARSLEGASLMVADRYQRGFETDMDMLVATPHGDDPALRRGLAAFAGAGAQADSPIRLSSTGIDADLARQWASPQAFGSAYATLAQGQHLEFIGETGLGHLAMKSAFADDGATYAAVELTHAIKGGHQIAFELGQLHENSAMLGTAITGAFGEDLSATTQFARIAGSLALGNQTSLTASGSFGTTGFSSSGIFAEGSGIHSSALGLGVRRSSVLALGDSLTIGVSRPLGISGGRMVLDTPQAFEASEGGVRSSGIYRDRSEIDLVRSETLADIQVGYARDFGAGRASFGGVWRPDAPGQESYALTAGFSLAF